MPKSAIFGLIVVVLAVSVASAASFIKPANTDEGFCFGYAICE
jgi:hypothetical protein